MKEKKEKINWWIIAAILVISVVIMVLAVVGAGSARAETKNCLCHNILHNPIEVCSDDDSYKQGHQEHLDRGSDELGPCPVPTSTPTLIPTSTLMPTVEVTPTPECDEDCVTPTPTVTPEVTPEVTPIPKSNPPTFAGSSTEAPVCTQTAPEAVVNPHVYRNGDKAVVKWTPVSGNMVHIYYKQVTSPDWQYSVTVANIGYAEISGLDSMDISFAVQAVNDCSGGTSVMSKVIVDGNSSTWILFR